jgi:DNA-binding transcriptional LysR family regulator
MNPQGLERRMTLHQLRILVTVVEYGSFSRAGEALALTQPAVSHQVQALARAIGHPLFQPMRGTPELTPVGRALYERARRILALVAETGKEIEELTGVRTGSLSVAGDTTVGIYVLPDALAGFRRVRPGVELRLDVLNRQQVRDRLLSGDADLGVVGRPFEADLFFAEPLLENTLMCFSAPDHPLVGREPLRPAQLLDGPLLLREPGSGTRESAEAILRQQGVEPVAAMQLASNGALKRAVARGLGVTVLSVYAARLEIELGLLHPLRVEGFPARRTWHVVWPRERILSPAAQAFRAYLHTPEWRTSLPLSLGSD